MFILYMNLKNRLSRSPTPSEMLTMKLNLYGSDVSTDDDISICSLNSNDIEELAPKGREAKQLRSDTKRQVSF